MDLVPALANLFTSNTENTVYDGYFGVLRYDYEMAQAYTAFVRTASTGFRSWIAFLDDLVLLYVYASESTGEFGPYATYRSSKAT